MPGARPARKAAPSSGKRAGVAFPELLRDWDPANDRDPGTITYGASYGARWICADCGHRWSAPVDQRVLRRTRCRVCHRPWATPETSLAARCPELVAEEWSAKWNLPRTPERLTVRSAESFRSRGRYYPELHPRFPMSPRTRIRKVRENKTACPEWRGAVRVQRARRQPALPGAAS